MKEEIWGKNLVTLKNVNSEMAEKLINYDNGYYAAMSLNQAGRKTPNLIYHGTKPPIIFYDPQDPGHDIKGFLKGIIKEKCRFPVLLGLGLGYMAYEILKREKDLIKMIIIEKEMACMKTAMQSVDLTEIVNHPKVKIIAGCTEQDLYVTIYNAIHPQFAGLKEIKILPLPASIAISKTYYSQVMKTFQQIANTFGADRGNDPYDTLVAYEQFFANINELMTHPGADHVKDLFKDRPAVVVATGPSLKKNIHLLKELENSAVIVSADASLRILHNNDIYPHLVTTIERPPGFEAYYKGLKNLDKTVFAVVSFVHPSTLKAYTGPRLFFHRLYNFMISLGFEKDAIKMGMSTANMAYEVARHMGCNPIILVGNDLAFDSSGNTHAKGFILGEKQPLYEDFDKFYVPGNYESQVKTCDGWLACIKEYEKRIEKWEGKLINATEGGAKIRGTTVMKLKEAISRYCTLSFNPREALLKHLSVWQNPRSVPSMLNTLDRYLSITDSFIDISRKMHVMLDSTLRDIESAGDSLPPSLVKQISDSVPHVETVLNSIMETELMKYFEEYFYTDIFPLLMEWQVIHERFSDPVWANAYRVKLAENFFGSMGQLCISLKEVLNDGKKRLRALQ